MDIDHSQTIKSRHLFSNKRLSELGSDISKIDILANLPDLCIYITGSYGRLEASKYSDVDLFFIHKGSQEQGMISKLDEIRLYAKLIDCVEEQKLPGFSNDGEYLTVHYLDDIHTALGSPSDDYRNFFTTRMLLLLESRSLFNDCVYKNAINATIDSYYRDYHDHEKDFRPVFLINDIIRFWKTLCLNYEHRRNRKNLNEEQKNKNHLKNLKLKFSRMLTCFSAVPLLVRDRSVIDPEKLSEIIHKSPLERLNQTTEFIPDINELVAEIEKNYVWFLDATNKLPSEAATWISDDETRNEAFDRARKFGGDMYKLLVKSTTKTDLLRYIVL